MPSITKTSKRITVRSSDPHLIFLTMNCAGMNNVLWVSLTQAMNHLSLKLVIVPNF